MATYNDTLAKTRRSATFKDRDRVTTYVKEEDAITTYSHSFAADLDSGVTVSSVATETDGVTLDSSSLATPVWTFTISSTNGELKITATLSDGDKLVERFRFVSPTGDMARDYRT